MQQNVNRNKGFTIFEALIYIALFSFIIGGGVLSAYQIFDGQWQIQQMAREEAELNFVLRKLDWLTTGNISPLSNSNEIVVNKGLNLYTVTTSDNRITLNDEPLSTLLEVSALNFTLNEGGPDVLEIKITVNGEEIGPITRYVRTD